MTSPQIVKIHDLFMIIQVSDSDSRLFRFIHDCGHPESLTVSFGILAIFRLKCNEQHSSIPKRQIKILVTFS